MYTLKIEHGVRSFETWKAAFERDPAGRQQGGVRCYRVCRSANDPLYVLVDLDFDTLPKAQAFLAAMQQLWSRAEVGPLMTPQGAATAAPPRTTIVELVDGQTY
jgi:hypothetical protein